MSALIIMRMQNDYINLCYAYEKIILNNICLINKYKKQFDLVVFIKDWYPSNHVIFKNNNKLYCIQNTKGSEIHPGLIVDNIDHVIHINTSNVYTSNSGFYNIKTATNSIKSNLQNILDANNIENVYICGIELENHIFSSIMDAKNLGYNCFVLKNLCYGFKETGINACLKFMEDNGINIITLSQNDIKQNSNLELKQDLELELENLELEQDLEFKQELELEDLELEQDLEQDQKQESDNIWSNEYDF